jgi:hypothetical protein
MLCDTITKKPMQISGIKGTPLRFFLHDGTGNNFSKIMFHLM